ncbi:MAG: NUDIX domain-containing protein [Gemmatimonadota bacterium]
MFEIPSERLPPGFADTVDEPPSEPVEPRPAATTVLLRDGARGLEVLLMRRHRQSGFVPGAWVFPGGRVDDADADPALIDRVRGLAAELRPPAPFWAAALRELFEETGVLLARDGHGRWAPDAASDPELDRCRADLLEDRTGLHTVLATLDLTADIGPVVHVAHWVTPVVEARRYDTHFFAAALPEGRSATPDPREMTRAAWLRPAEALERFERGELPMVFPTVRTLETLVDHGSARDVLDTFRGRTIDRILPRLVRTETGVGIVVDP